MGDGVRASSLARSVQLEEPPPSRVKNTPSSFSEQLDGEQQVKQQPGLSRVRASSCCCSGASSWQPANVCLGRQASAPAHLPRLV